MLTRRFAGPLAAALLIGLAPPLTGESRADTPQWAVQLTRDFLAAERLSSGRSVKIALLGDGVATHVHGLKGSMEKEKSLVHTPGPKRVLGTLTTSALTGGTPVANSPFGLRGLVPDATILPVRVYAAVNEPGGRSWQQTANWGQHIAGGIRYAVDHGANVIAVEPYSSGEQEATTGLRTAIAYAQAKNVVIVTPTGYQKPGYPPPYPASAPGVIGVGALTAKGRRDQHWTSKTSATLISAPATELPAIGPDGQV